MNITTKTESKLHTQCQRMKDMSSLYGDGSISTLKPSNPSMVFERASLFFGDCQDLENILQNTSYTDQDISCIDWSRSDQDCTFLSCAGPNLSLAKQTSFDDTDALLHSTLLLHKTGSGVSKRLACEDASYQNSSSLAKNSNSPTTYSICVFTMITFLVVYFTNNALSFTKLILAMLHQKNQICMGYLGNRTAELRSHNDGFVKKSVLMILNAILFVLRSGDKLICCSMYINELLCKPVPQSYLDKINGSHFIERN